MRESGACRTEPRFCLNRLLHKTLLFWFWGLSDKSKASASKRSLPERLLDVDTQWNIVSNKNAGFSGCTHSGVLGNLNPPRS